MTRDEGYDAETILERLKHRSPGEDAFHQAVGEWLPDIIDEANSRPEYKAASILERLTEPDRTIAFRVTWENDDGGVEVNRAWRVQFNGAVGPYKGGLRFHPTVDLSILKFLGFEQTFKNALTGLSLGGGKGGADFDPKGRSDGEIRRFCQAMMLELHRHIGPDIDVPAGDINVSSREIGYLYGAYRRITNEFEGSLTGKALSYGGSQLRTEATGYGLLHFVCHMLDRCSEQVDGKTVLVSGAGNVATHAAEKAADMGAKVLTLSDSKGFVYDPEGFDGEKIATVRRIKAGGQSLEAYAGQVQSAKWHAGETPWGVEADIALPCASQNELELHHARTLVENGCQLIAEGANMPLTKSANGFVRKCGVLFGPAKAANAGGVAVSGLEIAQNKTGLSRSRNDINEALHSIMRDIHDQCVACGERDGGKVDYALGANVSAFRKVAEAMHAQGF